MILFWRIVLNIKIQSPAILPSLSLFSCCRMIGRCSICPSPPLLIGRLGKCDSESQLLKKKLSKRTFKILWWQCIKIQCHQLKKLNQTKTDRFTQHLHVVRSRCTFLPNQLTFRKYKHCHEYENLHQNSFTNDLYKKIVLLVFHEWGPLYVKYNGPIPICRYCKMYMYNIFDGRETDWITSLVVLHSSGWSSDWWYFLYGILGNVVFTTEHDYGWK